MDTIAAIQRKANQLATDIEMVRTVSSSNKVSIIKTTAVNTAANATTVASTDKAASADQRPQSHTPTVHIVG